MGGGPAAGGWVGGRVGWMGGGISTVGGERERCRLG